MEAAKAMFEATRRGDAAAVRDPPGILRRPRKRVEEMKVNPLEKERCGHGPTDHRVANGGWFWSDWALRARSQSGYPHL